MRNLRPSFWFLSTGVALFVILGAIAIFLAIGQVKRSDWPKVDGTVVQVETYIDRDRDDDGHYSETRMYRPQVEFTADGRTYRFTSRISTSTSISVGETVEVVYNPSDPQQAEIAGRGTFVPWLLGGLAVLFGLMFGGGGLLMRRSAADR